MRASAEQAAMQMPVTKITSRLEPKTRAGNSAPLPEFQIRRRPDSRATISAALGTMEAILSGDFMAGGFALFSLRGIGTWRIAEEFRRCGRDGRADRLRNLHRDELAGRLVHRRAHGGHISSRELDPQPVFGFPKAERIADAPPAHFGDEKLDVHHLLKAQRLEKIARRIHARPADGGAAIVRVDAEAERTEERVL